MAALYMGAFVVVYFCRGSLCTPALAGTGSPLLTLLSSSPSPPVLPSPNPFMPSWGLGTVCGRGFWILNSNGAPLKTALLCGSPARKLHCTATVFVAPSY
jgi:hypothetical protein